MYNHTKVLVFVDEVRKACITKTDILLFLHAVSTGELTEHDFYTLLLSFEKLSNWEKANVIYGLSKDVEGIATDTARHFVRLARSEEENGR